MPSEKPTSPAAVAEAEPADDPLDRDRTRPSRSRRLATDSWCVPLNHRSPCASAPMESLADQHRAGFVAGAPRRWRRTSGTRFSNGSAPQVVGMPLVSKRSFTPNGMPCSGPRYLPGLISLSAAAACSQRQILGERDQAEQLGRVLLHAREVHLGEVGGRHGARAHQRRQFA